MSKRNKFILLSILFILMLALVVFSSQLFPNGDVLDPPNKLLPPSGERLFGTDYLGRDVMHRTFNGMKISLALSLTIQILSFAGGAVIGAAAGYFGKWVDKIYMVVQNVLLSFPGTIAALCIILMMGQGIISLIASLALIEWVSYAKLVRSEVITIKESDYILSARAAGAGSFYLLMRHILLNAVWTVVPVFTVMIGHTVLMISGLGFLGFGVQPPMAEIGMMISEGVTYMARAPWLLLCPGLTMAVYVLMINILGDLLREMMNPYSETSVF